MHSNMRILSSLLIESMLLDMIAISSFEGHSLTIIRRYLHVSTEIAPKTLLLLLHFHERVIAE